MQGAGAVLARFPIPTIAIASNPAVDSPCDEVNPGNKKQPRNQLPARKRQPDARPSVCTGVDAPAGIDGLHQAHRFFDVYLGKASGHAPVVKVEQRDAASRIQAAQTVDARTAQIASAIVKDRQFGHCSPRGVDRQFRRKASKRVASLPNATAGDFILASNSRGPRFAHCWREFFVPQSSSALSGNNAHFPVAATNTAC